jgi:hypothetical protein
VKIQYRICYSPGQWWVILNQLEQDFVAGAGVGIGLVFGSLIEATARNPSLRP